MEIGQEQQILVEVGTLEFCVDLNEVLSIITPPKMVRLPGARGAFIRAFKYLDELGAAVSMRVTFELEEREDMQSGQILLGRLNGRLAGFWFDKVVSILKLGDKLSVYEPQQALDLPCPDIDQLFVYQHRIIPHISLAALLRFKQAADWKQWLQTDKPLLEHRLLEAEVEASALADAAAAEAEAEAQPDVQHAPPAIPAMELDELYALMDAAGVRAEPVAKQLDSLSGEDVSVTSIVDETIPDTELESDPVAPDEPLQADEPAQEQEESMPSMPPEPALAVPVSPSNDNALSRGMAQIAAGVPDEDIAVSDVDTEDALFSLERKGAAYRQRMDAEQAVELADFQIIKVGEKGLVRRLRRATRRLFSWLLIGMFLALTLVVVEYVEAQGDPLPRVLVRTVGGEIDWAKSSTASGDELGRFIIFFGEFVQYQGRKLQ